MIFDAPNAPFHLLLDPPAAGSWNMAVDEALLEAAAVEGQCTLRFYQWAEPTLSLGYFQAYADRNQHEASRRSAVVRRTSGGGAIMHDFDVTYSLAVPEGHPLAADRLGTYRVVHDALVEVLAELGIEASLFGGGAPGLGCGSENVGREGDGGGCWQEIHRIESVSPTTSSVPFNLANSVPVPGTSSAEGSQPPGHCLSQAVAHRGDERRPIPKQPFLCFQRRATGDVLVKGEKVAGSAQRRSRGAVLQHGSVLFARSAAAPELDGLKELTAKTILVEEFIQAWLKRLSGALAVTWRRGDLSEEHRRRATQLAAEKYEAAAWTNAR